MYMTIVLRLLEGRPEMHDRLRRNRTLLQAVNHSADRLKASHEAWKERLAQTHPGESACPIASEALELALEELEDNWTSGDPAEGGQPPTLDGAMAFVRSRLPPK